MLDPRLGASLWALRLAFCVLPIASGLGRLHAAGPFNRVAGAFELAAGILVLTPFTRAAAYALSGWLVLLAARLVAGGGPYGLAAADLALAAGAFTLARLTGVNEGESRPGRPRRAWPLQAPLIRTLLGGSRRGYERR